MRELGPAHRRDRDLRGRSGLQYLGDGYYQFNWKTLKSYKGHCRTMTLSLGDGNEYTAEFQFT
jgi:hypothetical protein